jgi:hypothetical protein
MKLVAGKPNGSAALQTALLKLLTENNAAVSESANDNMSVKGEKES